MASVIAVRNGLVKSVIINCLYYKSSAAMSLKQQTTRHEYHKPYCRGGIVTELLLGLPRTTQSVHLYTHTLSVTHTSAHRLTHTHTLLRLAR